MEYRGIQFDIIKKYKNILVCQLKNTKKSIRPNKIQTFWISAKHFDENNNLKPNQNINYVFRIIKNKLLYAGYDIPTQSIIRKTTIDKWRSKHNV